MCHEHKSFLLSPLAHLAPLDTATLRRSHSCICTGTINLRTHSRWLEHTYSSSLRVWGLLPLYTATWSCHRCPVQWQSIYSAHSGTFLETPGYRWQKYRTISNLPIYLHITPELVLEGMVLFLIYKVIKETPSMYTVKSKIFFNVSQIVGSRPLCMIHRGYFGLAA